MTRGVLKNLFEDLARRVATEAEGQTLLEYALILTSVAVLTVAVLSAIGIDVVNLLTGAANAF